MTENPGAVLLEARGVSRRYTLGGETIHALRAVSLRVSRGDFLAVMGPSGSGKSTLLHLLGLIDRPDEGDIFVGGRSTRELGDDALTGLRREQLGFVFQTFELIPSLSARENILLPADIAGRRLEGEKRLSDLSERLGVADRLSHRPSQLSGGQRQRVALARALINDPLVILADEPTGNLDSHASQGVLELLRGGVREAGWSVVMVTHDERAAAYAERRVTLLDGRLTADEPARVSPG